MNPTSYIYIILYLILFLSAKIIAQVLAVPQKYQEKSQWCWAATSQAVLEYYDVRNTQSEIAQYGTEGENIWNWLYGSTYDPTRRGVDIILDYFGDISCRRYSSYFSIEKVLDEINGNRPIPIRWGWDSGGGHILVLHGISDSLIYLMDPSRGPTINSYDWLLKGSSHTWTHSLQLLNTPVSVFITSDHLPNTPVLHQNYPNPFNPGTTIKFVLPETEWVTLNVFNLLSQQMVTLVSEKLPAGEYSCFWDAGDLASGIYYYQISAGDFRDVKKMILVR